jgi:hypothetical protein
MKNKNKTISKTYIAQVLLTGAEKYVRENVVEPSMVTNLLVEYIAMFDVEAQFNKQMRKKVEERNKK